MLLNRIPEPHELADDYYAQLENDYRARIREATREECGHCTMAPKEWSTVPHGYCSESGEIVRADECIAAFDCECFIERW